MDGEIQKTVSSGTWMTETGKSALVEDREYVNQLSAAAGVYLSTIRQIYKWRKTGTG